METDENAWCIRPPCSLPGCGRWKGSDAADMMLDATMRLGDVSPERMQGEKKRGRIEEETLRKPPLKELEKKTIRVSEGKMEECEVCWKLE